MIYLLLFLVCLLCILLPVFFKVRSSIYNIDMKSTLDQCIDVICPQLDNFIMALTAFFVEANYVIIQDLNDICLYKGFSLLGHETISIAAVVWLVVVTSYFENIHEDEPLGSASCWSACWYSVPFPRTAT